MSLDLDARQRAMLAEMGIRLWAPPVPRRPARSPAPQPLPAVPAVVDVQSSATAQSGAVIARPASPRIAAAPGGTLEPLPEGVAGMGWDQLEAAVARCRACGLCQSRTRTVFGVGDRNADWMVVGEAPGRNEDRLGEPFVGQAGKLLDNMLAAIGLSRHASAAAASSGEGQSPGGVYIANVVKCRPPGNRNPQPGEIATCEPWLQRQIALVQPRIILAVGRFAVQSLLRTDAPIGRLRGRVHRYEDVPVVVTYHPAYLLRSPAAKGKAWEDLCLALAVAAGQVADPGEA